MIVTPLFAMLFAAPDLPARDCVPDSPRVLFPESRSELVDGTAAARLAGLSKAELDQALVSRGVVIGKGNVAILAAARETDRYEVLTLEAELANSELAFGTLSSDAESLLPPSERKENHEVIEVAQGHIVNLYARRMDGAELVAGHARSHWIARRGGKARLMAVARCEVGGAEAGVLEPRWTFGPTVEISGCNGVERVSATQLDGCALTAGDGARRAQDYVDLANEADNYAKLGRQLQIMRLALAATGQRTADEARKHRGLWTRYGKALLDAMRKDIPVDQTSALRALENATLVEDTDFARGYAFALLGDAFVAIADQSDPEMTEPLITTLESAVKAYEQSLKLHGDTGTKERLAVTKKRLKALR